MLPIVDQLYGCDAGIDALDDAVEHAAVRLVLALPLLVLHDAALALEHRLVDLRGEEAHAIGFEVERALERGDRHVLEEVRAVGVGRAVAVVGAEVVHRLAEAAADSAREPLKKKCSNRCAKPVLPRCSLREPTWYQRFTPTTGTEWSSWTRSVRPLSSTNFWCGISNGVRSNGRPRSWRRTRRRPTAGGRDDAGSGAVIVFDA